MARATSWRRSWRCFLAGIGAGLETGIVLTALGAAMIVNLAK